MEVSNIKEIFKKARNLVFSNEELTKLQKRGSIYMHFSFNGTRTHWVNQIEETLKSSDPMFVYLVCKLPYTEKIVVNLVDANNFLPKVREAIGILVKRNRLKSKQEEASVRAEKAIQRAFGPGKIFFYRSKHKAKITTKLIELEVSYDEEGYNLSICSIKLVPSKPFPIDYQQYNITQGLMKINIEI